jgi:cytochrome c oxidase assembly protein subunit 19
MTAKPPQRGVFPLDHFGECRPLLESHLACLSTSGGRAAACEDTARQYLECRMARDLMLPEELEKLGFRAGAEGRAKAAREEASRGSDDGRDKERAGFVAGLARVRKAAGKDE